MRRKKTELPSSWRRFISFCRLQRGKTACPAAIDYLCLLYSFAVRIYNKYQRRPYPARLRSNAAFTIKSRYSPFVQEISAFRFANKDPTGSCRRSFLSIPFVDIALRLRKNILQRLDRFRRTVKPSVEGQRSGIYSAKEKKGQSSHGQGNGRFRLRRIFNRCRTSLHRQRERTRVP